MGYGVASGLQGLGALQEGFGAARARHEQMEGARLQKLYTRYQLASQRRGEAEQLLAQHATSGNPPPLEVQSEAENARVEERSMRQQLYDSLAGKKSSQGGTGGLGGMLKTGLRHFMQLDEANLPSEVGHPAEGKGTEGTWSRRTYGTPSDIPGEEPKPSAPAPSIPQAENVPATTRTSPTPTRYSLSLPGAVTRDAHGIFHNAQGIPISTAPFIEPNTARSVQVPGSTATAAPTTEKPLPGTEEQDSGFGSFQTKNPSEVYSELAQLYPTVNPQAVTSGVQKKSRAQVEEIYNQLEGYTKNHVKGTFAEAMQNPKFAHYINSLLLVEGHPHNSKEEIVRHGQLNDFLDAHFPDAPNRTRATSPRTPEQLLEDQYVAAGSPEKHPYLDYLGHTSEAKKTREEREAETLAREAREEITATGKITGPAAKRYSFFHLGQQPTPSMGPVLLGTDKAGNPIWSRLDRSGTAASPVTGIEPPSPKMSIKDYEEKEPDLLIDEKGVPKGINPLRGQTTLRAKGIIFDHRHGKISDADLTNLVNSPQLFARPEEYKAIVDHYNETMGTKHPSFSVPPPARNLTSPPPQ